MNEKKKGTKNARWTQAFTPVPSSGHHRARPVWFGGHMQKNVDNDNSYHHYHHLP